MKISITKINDIWWYNFLMTETGKVWGRGLVLLGLLLLLVFLLLPRDLVAKAESMLAGVVGGEVVASGDGLLTVAFLDVGQGDAIYIETPDGVQMLIDGGRDSTVLSKLSAVMPFFDKSLDVVLATHSDLDHIGGLVDVLKRYEVERIVRTNNKNETEVADAFAALAQVEKTVGSYIATAGQQYELGASTTLWVLSPQGDPTNWESNSASIVAQLQYGEVAFMLTGDAPIGIEDYLVGTYGPLLQSDVLKLGHHGSKTSSGDLFLKAVAPSYGVVSAGADNRYGHPHTEVIERVSEAGSIILNTAETGTIIFKSDGKRVWVE